MAAGRSSPATSGRRHGYERCTVRGQHQAIRDAQLPYAYGRPCTRCGRLMLPGQLLDLDHTDDGASYLGFAHARCNRIAGGRLGNTRRRTRSERIQIMLKDVVLGVDIAEDRSHTSIVAAGRLDDGSVLISLLHYLDGTDAVPRVTAEQAARTVLAVILDPHSPGATLIAPLKAAGIKVTELSTSDVAVAHGEFLDELAAGRIRHAGQPILDAAVRHGTQRTLGGASAWQRRGAVVDVSPALAAEWAVWGLLHAPPPVKPWAVFV
jgi:hypothetical protein